MDELARVTEEIEEAAVPTLTGAGARVRRLLEILEREEETDGESA